HSDLIEPCRAFWAAEIEDPVRLWREGRVKRVIKNKPSQTPRRGVLGNVIFQIQSAKEQLTLAIVQLHERCVAQVEFAFQQGTPTATVRLLNSRTADASAVAPMPPGVGLFSFIPSEVIACILWEAFNESAAARPIAKVDGIRATGELRTDRKYTTGDFWAY